MHRIDTSTAQVDKFGKGKNGFTGGNPQTGELPTALDADFFDAVQEEISGLIEAAGLKLDKTNNAQMTSAIKALVGFGRLLGPPQIFTASGTYTPTPGTKNVLVEVLAAGGGGGGAGSTGSSSYSSGSGGSAGGYAKSFLTSGFSGQPITVGTGGTAGNGAPSNGGAGGDSSFGSIIANGGGGGLTQPPTTANYTQTGQSGGQATGGNLINNRGGSSGYTLRYDTINFTGFGGSSEYGAGGSGFAFPNSNGFDGSGCGAGGSGAASFNSPSAYYSGGKGSDGVVIIWEYA